MKIFNSLCNNSWYWTLYIKRYESKSLAYQMLRVPLPFPAIPIYFFIYFLKCMQIQMIPCDWCFVARLSGGYIAVPFYLSEIGICFSFSLSRNNESNLLVPYSIWWRKIRYNKIIQILANVSYKCIVRTFFFNLICHGVCLPVVGNLFELGE